MSPDPTVRPPLCVGLGELLWDCLPAGRALGGAPANVAAHAAQLGARGVVVSAVGDDADGRALVGQLQALGVGTAGVQVARGLPTGLVDVALDAAGVPTFTIRAPAAWDALEPEATALSLARAADAIVFGSLAQRDPRSRGAIGALLRAARPGCLRVFDVNLRPPFVDAAVIRDGLAQADVLKCNDAELPVLAVLAGLSPAEADPLRALRVRYELGLAVCTEGPRGSRMLSADWEGRQPAAPAEVADTVGAGDAFTAAVVVGLLRGLPPARIQELANRVAAFVCSRAGAVPRLPAELTDAFTRA